MGCYPECVQGRLIHSASYDSSRNVLAGEYAEAQRRMHLERYMRSRL